MQSIECPLEGDLRAYLQREHEGDQTSGIETHLVGCRACRLALLNWQVESDERFEIIPAPPKLKERVSKTNSPRSSFWQNLTGQSSTPAFAIAALVLIAITAAGLWRFANPVVKVNQNGEGLRSDDRRVSSVRAVSPSENSVVPGPAVEFKWATEAKANRYTVEVLSEKGDIVYQAVTSEEHITADASKAQLQSQRKYYWHVKAKLADGAEVSTDPIPFSIGAKQN